MGKMTPKSDAEIMTDYWCTFQFKDVSFYADADSKGRGCIGLTRNYYRAGVLTNYQYVMTVGQRLKASPHTTW